MNLKELSKIQDKDSLSHKIGRAVGIAKERIPKIMFDTFKKKWRIKTFIKPSDRSSKKKSIIVSIEVPQGIDAHGTMLKPEGLKVVKGTNTVEVLYRPDDGKWIPSVDEA